jgi:hypothetical protein
MPPLNRPPSAVAPAAARPLRLEELLRLLPARELQAIISGLSLSVDRSKRLDLPAQVARALLSRPEARDPGVLAEPSLQLLRRLIEAGGVLTVESLPPALQPLVARGLVFARRAERATAAPEGAAAGTAVGAVELILPAAYLLQLPLGDGEDPRGLRALLLQCGADVTAAVAGHYLGSTPTHPLSLALETAWLTLTDPVALAAELEGLSVPERRLLDAVVSLGGEVNTEELLELEREPLRLRTASGSTPSRRGVGFALERRGLLVPVHPDRHVVPTEVARAIGASASAQRQTRRAEILAEVEQIDQTPLRARYAHSPAPLALALLGQVRERGQEVKSGVGTPRSLLTRLATRFGEPPEAVALVAALSRAVGLWDTSARTRAASPGGLTLSELGLRLFEVWRAGAVWDEARPEPEVLRASGAAREASAVGGLRELVLSALGDLAAERWVSWEAVSGFILTDARAPGLQRLLDRWCKRLGFAPEHVRLEAVARRMVFDSLYTLGCVDTAGHGYTGVVPASSASSSVPHRHVHDHVNDHVNGGLHTGIDRVSRSRQVPYGLLLAVAATLPGKPLT